MVRQEKKLGILVSASPKRPNFEHGLHLAAAALAAGVDVYLFCIDDAVSGVGDSRLQAMRERGLKLFACAYGAERRGILARQQAVFAGLAVVSDLLSATDRFISFN